MEQTGLFYPTRNKLAIYLVLVIVFLIRFGDSVNTLEVECADGKCTHTGELRRHVGYPFETYKITVAGETHYNYFYDFNFAVDLGVWYLVACALDYLLGRALAGKGAEPAPQKGKR